MIRAAMAHTTAPRIGPVSSATRFQSISIPGVFIAVHFNKPAPVRSVYARAVCPQEPSGRTIMDAGEPILTLRACCQYSSTHGLPNGVNYIAFQLIVSTSQPTEGYGRIGSTSYPRSQSGTSLRAASLRWTSSGDASPAPANFRATGRAVFCSSQVANIASSSETGFPRCRSHAPRINLIKGSAPPITWTLRVHSSPPFSKG